MRKTEFERGAGVLCHISSLPGKYGIGSLGSEAYEFVDFLSRSKVKYWQILPLAQTGYGDSPYQSVCGNSGNPYFIDLEELKRLYLLDDEELSDAEMPAGDVDYGELYVKRYAALRRAYARFNVKDKDFVTFVESGEFEDYAVFMSLKTLYGASFVDFPCAYKYRESLAISEFKSGENKKEYYFWLFLQYMFKKQWKKLKEYANSKGIKIIGDMPLYVARDSSDVWARPDMFCLDKDLNPAFVAGVPPDYFSETGQLWGNPVYDWEAAEKDRYAWWVERIRRAFEMYDIVRMDHFRGFDRYYAIPAGSDTAKTGEWRNGPGIRLFRAAARKMGRLMVIAEDLGEIDAGVIALRRAAGFPGMKILMFAFDGNAHNEYLPEFIDENSVTYTGTHDNDTALGYINGMTDEQFAEFVKRLRAALKGENVVYPVVSREDAVRALVKCAFHTRSQIAVIPIQDILGLDNSARMNVPSCASGNWKFRLDRIPDRSVAARLRNAVKASNRAE